MTQAWFKLDSGAFGRLESLLRARYPTLHASIVDGECRIRGTVASVETDRYVLDIVLPGKYPHALPSVWEIGCRIPREIDRHVFEDGSLCLGAPLALWIQLGGDYSIERVIEGPLRSFLIGNSLVEESERPGDLCYDIDCLKKQSKDIKWRGAAADQELVARGAVSVRRHRHASRLLIGSAKET